MWNNRVCIHPLTSTTENCTKCIKQWFSRHKLSGSRRKRSMRKEKQTRGELQLFHVTAWRELPRFRVREGEPRPRPVISLS